MRKTNVRRFTFPLFQFPVGHTDEVRWNKRALLVKLCRLRARLAPVFSCCKVPCYFKLQVVQINHSLCETEVCSAARNGRPRIFTKVKVICHKHVDRNSMPGQKVDGWMYPPQGHCYVIRIL